MASLAHFFDRCRLVSDAEMQSLWARLLAEESNRPTTFSKRTIDLVATLDKADAKLFAKLCTFVWIAAAGPMPVIFDTREPLYNRHDIGFSTLTHLDSIGLVKFDNNQTFIIERQPKSITVFYFGKPLTVEFLNESNNVLMTGCTLLTRAGQELWRICAAEPSGEYFQYIVGKWIQNSYVLSSPLPAPQTPCGASVQG